MLEQSYMLPGGGHNVTMLDHSGVTTLELEAAGLVDTSSWVFRSTSAWLC